MIQTIFTIAQQCDGIRCDMAMLMLNRSSNAPGAAALDRRPQQNIGLMSSPPRRGIIPGSSLLPKPTGIWSGNSSNRVSIFATTRNFTTGWSTAMQRASAYICVLILLTKISFSVSSRTMTSHGLLQPFRLQSSAPLH